MPRWQLYRAVLTSRCTRSNQRTETTRAAGVASFDVERAQTGCGKQPRAGMTSFRSSESFDTSSIVGFTHVLDCF
jgi:hypothetical protein